MCTKIQIASGDCAQCGKHAKGDAFYQEGTTMKNNIRVTLEYDGSRYDGWQKQGNTDNTIQGKLETVLFKMAGEEIEIHGSGRTDAGVHARGQVANFHIDAKICPDGKTAKDYLNRYLPEDIRVLSAELASGRFHSRLSAVSKTYGYYVETGDKKDVFERKYVYGYGKKLDVEAMQRAAEFIIGEHDFISFCAANHQAEETVRTIYGAEVKKNDEDIVTIRLCGSGFLYNMVRIIAGTLLKVGTGEWEPEHVKEVLEARNRKEAGQTAPAKGLTLVGIEYEREIPKEIIGRNEHWDAVLDQTSLESDGVSRVRIRFSEPEELPRLIRRMVHQAYRNGAKEVFVTIPDGYEVSETESYGYYRLRRLDDGSYGTEYTGRAL